MKQKAHIGKVTSQKDLMVEAGLVDRFVDALGIEDPLSTDPAAAKAAGLTGRLLPHVAASTLGDFQSVIDVLELKPKQVLHSTETITIYQSLCVGDEMKVTTRIKDLKEQMAGGNPMGFVFIEVVGSGKRNVRLFEAQRVLAVRGGFPRR